MLNPPIDARSVRCHRGWRILSKTVAALSVLWYMSPVAKCTVKVKAPQLQAQMGLPASHREA
jgi:hypothetical protein